MRYIVRTVSWAPERLKNVERMLEQIPALEVHTDEVRDGYRSFLDVCEKVNDTGAVVLEDDVELCSDFCEQVERVITEYGADKVINFFERPKVYFATGRVGGSQFLWTQCVYLPPGLPGKIIAHYDAFKKNHPDRWRGMAYDRLIAYALTKERIPYWRIRPCLVQHLPFKSAIGSRSTYRQSPYYIEILRAQGVRYEDLRPE